MTEPTAKSNTAWLWIVWLILCGLLLLTVGLNHVNLGRWGTPVALLIATLKATLVAVYYMHLRHSENLMRLIAAGTVVWLLAMFTLTYADLFSRSW